MEVFALLLGISIVLLGVFCFLYGVYNLAIAFYYGYIAGAKKINKGYERYVLKRSREYKSFEKEINKLIK